MKSVIVLIQNVLRYSAV